MEISEDNVDQLLDNIAIETQDVKPEAKQEVKQEAKYELEDQIRNLFDKIDESVECNGDDFKSISKIIQEFASIKNINEKLSAEFLKLLKIVIETTLFGENHDKLETLIDGLIQNISKMQFNKQGVTNLFSIVENMYSNKILCIDKFKLLIDKCNEIDIESFDENKKSNLERKRNKLMAEYYFGKFYNAIDIKNKTVKNIDVARTTFEQMLKLLKHSNVMFINRTINVIKDTFHYKIITSENKDLLVDFISKTKIDEPDINNLLSKVLLPNDVKDTELDKIIEPLNQDKYNKLKFSMSLSDEFLIKQLLLEEDLSIYTDEASHIIRNMNLSTNEHEIKLSNEQRIGILKGLYGEEFVNFYYNEMQSEIDKIDKNDKKANEQSIQEEININKDVVLRRQNVILFVMNIFDSVYDRLMNVTGLSYLKNNRTIKFRFGTDKVDGSAWYSSLDQNVYLGKSIWEELIKYAENINQYKKYCQSVFLHELTHYVQDLLCKENFDGLSSAGQQLVKAIKDDNFKYNSGQLSYMRNYSKDTKEIGAHMTQFFDAIEKCCGKEYGEYFVQEKATEQSQNVQAKKIVDELRKKGVIKDIFNSKGHCADFWNTLFNKVSTTTFQCYETRIMFENIMSLKGITDNDLTKNEINCCKHLETIFSEALKYLIPKEDMIKINDKLSQS